MKKRNFAIVAFLLVAALTLGIGFAALSSSLTIGGTARYDPTSADNTFKKNIYFSAGEIADQATSGDASKDKILTDLQNAATSKTVKEVSYEVASLTYEDNYVTFAFTIANENFVDADVTCKLNDGSGNTDGLFSVEYFVVDGTTDEPITTDGTTVTFQLPSATGTTDNVTPSETVVKVKVTLDSIPNTTAGQASINNAYNLEIVATMATNP